MPAVLRTTVASCEGIFISQLVSYETPFAPRIDEGLQTLVTQRQKALDDGAGLQRYKRQETKSKRNILQDMSCPAAIKIGVSYGPVFVAIYHRHRAEAIVATQRIFTTMHANVLN